MCVAPHNLRFCSVYWHIFLVLYKKRDIWKERCMYHLQFGRERMYQRPDSPCTHGGPAMNILCITYSHIYIYNSYSMYVQIQLFNSSSQSTVFCCFDFMNPSTSFIYSVLCSSTLVRIYKRLYIDLLTKDGKVQDSAHWFFLEVVWLLFTTAK